MEAPKNIVIVGGGFAGTTLARALERRLPAGHRVVLVSEESYTTFNPMLAEVVGASVFPEHVVAPIRQMLCGRQPLRHGARRRASTSSAGMLDCIDAGRARQIAYAQLVFAFGTRANLDTGAGTGQHALPLKLVGDAMFIRNRVLQRVARIELERDPALRRRLGHFIVIGGGFSGVEVAGELADFLRQRAPLLPARAARRTEGHDAAGQRQPAARAARVARPRARRSRCARAASTCACARAPRASTPTACALDERRMPQRRDRRSAPSARGRNPLVEQLGLALQRGRIVTAADLSVPGAPGVWAIGDCALVRNHAADAHRPPEAGPAYPVSYAPPTAQFAVAQAQALARNLVARIARPADARRSATSRAE